MKVTKVYELEEEGMFYCIAPLYRDDYNNGCMNRATVHIKITTTTIESKKVVNKIGFCNKHLSRKYRIWFKLPDYNDPSRL